MKGAVEARGYRPLVVEYLKNPPSVAELDAIRRKLKLEPQAVARRKEPAYAEAVARCKTRQDWLKALHDHPVLIQRPIVILDDRALIARPPEALASWI